MTPHLLADYAATIRELEPKDIENPLAAEALKMAEVDVAGRRVEMVYAPFDHVNCNAKVAIVGMTPGKYQASNALRCAQDELRQGRPAARAAETAKVFASFSGEPMRSNLVRMLDAVGVARFLGVSSTSQLWDEQSSLVHFTSALRYPVFVDGQNWSGQPNMVRTAPLRDWLEAYVGTELRLLRDAVIVPLGPKVGEAMLHLARSGTIDGSRVLDGLPHPSGANAERIAYFLGDKPAHKCSSKTNTSQLDEARISLKDRMAMLESVPDLASTAS